MLPSSQQKDINITTEFQVLYMYDKKNKRLTSHTIFTPPLPCHTFLVPLPPLERDDFMDGTFTQTVTAKIYLIPFWNINVALSNYKPTFRKC